MKNKLLKTISISSLFALASQMSYAVEATLTLGGQIAPGSCTLDVEGGGNFGYGNLQAAALNATGNTPLAIKFLNYRIDCDAPTAVGMRMSDNRGNIVGGITPDQYTYGLGVDNSGGAVGYVNYLLYPSAGVGGGSFPTPIGIIESSDNGTSWTIPDENADFNIVLANSRSKIYSWAPASNFTSPTLIEQVVGSVGVGPVIAPKSGLDLNRAVDLNGSATLELYYL